MSRGKPRSSLQLRSNLFETSNSRALIHSLGSFITADSRERNGKGVSGETVDGVREGRWKRATRNNELSSTGVRRSPLSLSLVSFRVFSSEFPSLDVLYQPRFHPSVKRATIKRTSIRLKDEDASPRGYLLPSSFVLTSKIDPRFEDEETIEKIVRRIVRRNDLHEFYRRSTFQKIEFCSDWTNFSFLLIYLFLLFSILLFDFSSRKGEQSWEKKKKHLETKSNSSR